MQRVFIVIEAHHKATSTLTSRPLALRSHYTESSAITRKMASLSSAHQQVLDHLSSGDFYSAHQKARTTATRLLAPPRRNPPPAGTVLPYDTKAQEAAETLWDAARKLLENGQQGSGVDLATMLVQDVWTARDVGCDKEERGESPRRIPGSGGLARFSGTSSSPLGSPSQS